MRMTKLLGLVCVLIVAIGWWQQHHAPDPAAANRPATVDATASGIDHGDALPAFLPAQARDTLARIARGGPFEHSQDGVVFGNYEGLLPQQPRGYYHEYTVETPGARTRGARRIITGGTPPVVWYYTDDHYRSFRPFEWHP